MAKAKAKKTASKHDPTALGRGFKQRLKRGDILLGGMVAEYLHPSLAKLYSHAGFDFIFVDKEHTYFDGGEMTDFTITARDNGLPVISKVGDLGRAEVARLLEAGVVGIQLPRTETREELEELADYMLFPPRGTRAGAPGLGNTDYAPPADHAEWLRKADESLFIVAHIETDVAFENAEEIVSTPCVDMVYIGPYDFSIAMGYPGDYDHPVVRRAMEKVLKLCLKHKVPFGTTASSPKAAGQWIRKGCQFFEVVDELTLILEGSKEIVGEYRRVERKR